MEVLAWPLTLHLDKAAQVLLITVLEIWIPIVTSLILSGAEERFEVSGDEMERHMSLSLDEPELLRREMPAADAAGFAGDETPGSYDANADERMEPPPDGMFDNMATMPDFDAAPPSREVC